MSALKREVKPKSLYKRKWREANKEKVKEYSCQYRLLHRERDREKAATRRAANLEQFRRIRREHMRKKYPTPTREEPLVCELCGNAPGRTSLHLDHDHEKKTFRGWLCKFCNVGLGCFKDNPALLRKAAEYLEK